MCRLFPGVKRSTLHGIVQECKGDVTMSVEQLLSGQKDGFVASTVHPAARYFLQSGTSHLLQSLYALPNSPYANMAALKTPSVFPPMHQLSHHSSMRPNYPLPARSLPFALPYTQHLLPGLGFNYSPVAAVTGLPSFAQQKPGPLPFECGLLPGAPAPDNQ